MRNYLIRPFQRQDAETLWDLFFHTIRKINLGDYTQEQVETWAPESHDEQAWANKLAQNQPFVCLWDDSIVGFSDLQPDGYIDHFFVHHMHQRKGVGRALMRHIVEQANNREIEKLYSNVSITARPFFTSHQFEELEEQTVEVRGQLFINYRMQRTLASNPKTLSLKSHPP